MGIDELDGLAEYLDSLGYLVRKDSRSISINDEDWRELVCIEQVGREAGCRIYASGEPVEEVSSIDGIQVDQRSLEMGINSVFSCAASLTRETGRAIQAAAVLRHIMEWLAGVKG